MTRSCRLLTVLLATSAAWAAPTLEQEQELRTDFVTPHTNWARPAAAGGTMRVLFFSDYQNCAAREAVEAMQRFDLIADAVLWGTIVDTTTAQWHGGEEGVARARRLLEQPYDVYWFNECDPTRLPTELQYKLLKRVTEGAGLVLVGCDDARVLKRPLTAQPGDPDAALFSIVKGRGARLPKTPRLAYRFGWEAEYDYWQERLGRTLLWAGGRLPSPRPLVFAEKTPTDTLTPLHPEALAGRRLAYRLRRLDGRVFGTGALTVAGGQIALPKVHLPAGDYHWDLFLTCAPAGATDKQAIVDSTTLPFAVAAPVQAALTLDRDFAELGETLSGSVKLEGQVTGEMRQRVELVDRFQRVLARQELPPPRGERATFSFAVPAWFPMLVQVRATVSDANGELAAADAYAHVTQRHRGQFNFLVWDYPNGPTAAFGEESLAQLGMTLQLAWGAPPRQVAADNVAWVPYTTRILDDKDAHGVTQPVSWNHEPDIAAYVKKIVDVHQPAREHGTFVYSLGDENVTRGCDSSPWDLAAYRGWLQRAYGNIEALNASWGTPLKSFDEVVLLDPTDPKELKAKAAGQFARWYDRQAFSCWNYLNLCKRFVDGYAALDPQARCGFEGAGTFAEGDDFDSIVRTVTFWSPYPGPADLVLRDIAPRDFPRANWMGYDKDPAPLISTYWRMVLNGNDAVWWWRWENIGRFIGLLRPDLSPFDEVKELFADTRVTREGLGDLLLHSQMQDDGIAMLYSMPSAYACQLGDGPSYGTYEQAHVAWHTMLGNQGLNFRYFTDGQFRRGEFDGKPFKVLLLPRAEALGEAEAKVIADFAAAGGTVIADVRPGRYTEHCRPRVAGALDELFGVDTSGSAAAKTGPVELDAGGKSVTVKDLAVDPGVKAPAGASPVLLQRSVGRGRVVLLNGASPALTRAAGPVIAQLLAAAGVHPAVQVVRPPAAPGDVRVVRWRDGDADIVAVQPQMNLGAAPLAATLQLAGARRVISVKSGHDLGRVDHFPIELRAGRAQIFALLPAAPVEIVAQATPARAAAGSEIKLRLAAPGAAGTLAVLVTVQQPDGSAAPWLRQVALIPPAGTTVTLPIALNDPTGAWRVAVKELFTQHTSAASFTVAGGS
jgi:beta-galactosidase